MLQCFKPDRRARARDISGKADIYSSTGKGADKACGAKADKEKAAGASVPCNAPIKAGGFVLHRPLGAEPPLDVATLFGATNNEGSSQENGDGNLLAKLAVQAYQEAQRERAEATSLFKKKKNGKVDAYPTSPDKELILRFYAAFMEALHTADSKWANGLEHMLHNECKIIVTDDRTGQPAQVGKGKKEVIRRLNLGVEVASGALTNRNIDVEELKQALNVSEPEQISPGRWVIKTAVRRGILKFNFLTSIKVKEGAIARIKQGR